MNQTINLSPKIVSFLDDPNKLAILVYLFSRKGQIVSLTMSRPLKFLAKYKNLGLKGNVKTKMQVRCGIAYDNLRKTIEARQNLDLPIKNQGLIGRKWIDYPYLMISTSKDQKLMFRFYPFGDNVVSQYTLNDKIVEKEQIKEYCLASEFRERSRIDCFDLPISNIVEVS